MLSHMSPSEPTRAGFVLAGGESSRMGTDKAFLEFEGQTLLDRALNTVGAVCDRVAIVGDPLKFARHSEKHAVMADVFRGCGPLGGIHAALTQPAAEFNLMLGVDMPFVSTGLLEFLFTAAAESGSTVTVPHVAKGWQPLCAIYRRDFVPVAEKALQAGNYKIDALFTSVSLRTIDEKELTAAGFLPRIFFNLNTPDDRRAAEGRSR